MLRQVDWNYSRSARRLRPCFRRGWWYTIKRLPGKNSMSWLHWFAKPTVMCCILGEIFLNSHTSLSRSSTPLTYPAVTERIELGDEVEGPGYFRPAYQ